MSDLGINGITNYTTLYSVYSRLAAEGDRTASAKNAKGLFGIDVDADGDGKAELWEFMQKANEAQGRTIFEEISRLKSIPDNKYPNISADNPIRYILAIESEVVGDRKTENAYRRIDQLISTARKKIRPQMSVKEKMKMLTDILKKDLKITYKPTVFMGEGLSTGNRVADCDVAGFMLIAVAHELNWPLYLESVPRHSFVIWDKGNSEYEVFDTMSGEQQTLDLFSVATPQAKRYIDNFYNVLAASAHDDLGESYAANEMLDLAITEYTKAVDLNPYEEQAYCNRGNCLSRKGELDAANKDYTRAIELRPDYMLAFHNRGTNYLHSGRNDLAIIDLTRAIKLDVLEEYISYSFICRAKAYAGLGRKDLAIKDFNAAVEKDPKNMATYANRALFYTTSEQFELARADHIKTIELDPKFVPSYMNLGFVNYKLGRYGEALLQFNRILAGLAPNDANTFENRGETYLELRKYDRALQDMTRSIQLDPSDKEKYWYRSLAYFHAGHYLLAAKDYSAYQWKRLKSLGTSVLTSFKSSLL